MSRPHPALIELAAGRGRPLVDDPWALVDSALEHRMTGVLWTWERDRPSSTSERWHAELQRRDLLARARAQRQWTTLQTVVQRLNAIEVEVVAIKGVTTEARWYGRRGERPCDDVDILIGPAHLDRTEDIVEVLQPRHPLRTHLSTLVRTGALPAIAVMVGDVSVDLHFDLLQLGMPLRQAGPIWERTMRFQLPEGGVVRVLDPETALFHLLLNLNKDRFARLLGYVDVARLVQQEHLNWDSFDEMVRTEGLETPTYLALNAVSTTLAIPTASLPMPGGPRPMLWRFLWRPSVRLQGAASCPRFLHRQHLLVVTASGRARDTLRMWRRLLFPAAPLVQYAFPGETGHRLWRLTVSRGRRAWTRRKETFLEQRGRDLAAPRSLRQSRPVNASFVPIIRPTVASVQLDGETVLLDEATGALCLLDPVATVVWSCFDGWSTVKHLAIDLAVEFGADPDQVLTDVIGLARRLARNGMLEV